MKPVMKKKADQLGMNPSVASQRLIRDLLFSYVKDTPCHHCGEALTRETFSVEHKKPWLDSDDPVAVFFDLENISYSHLSCNSRAARKPTKIYASKKEYAAAKRKRWYTPEKRREIYLRTGN